MKQLIIGLSILSFMTIGCQSTTKKENAADSTSTAQVEQKVEETALAHKSTDLQASFKNINGEAVSISDLKGKVVVMNFWATWCPPCIKELPSLQGLQDEFKEEKNIVFMAIEMDQDIDKAAQFMAKNKFTIPLYTLNSELPEELMTNSIPMTVILAKNGDIVGKQIGMMDFQSEKLKQGLIELTKENQPNAVLDSE